MVAVYLDEPSVQKLRAHFPEARDGQLRRVVLQYGPSASEREMYRHLFNKKAQVTVRRDSLVTSLTGSSPPFCEETMLSSGDYGRRSRDTFRDSG